MKKRLLIVVLLVGLVAYWIFYPTTEKDVEGRSTSVFKVFKPKTKVDQLEDRIAALELQMRALQSQSEKMNTMVVGAAAHPDRISSEMVSPHSRSTAKIPASAEEVSSFMSTWKKNLSAYDQNRDGKLSVEEANVSPEVFAAVDSNGDGRIDDRDIELKQRFEEQANDYIKKRDGGDKAYPIEKTEFQGTEEEFAYVDKDRDGALAEGEYVEFLKQGRAERNRFDGNKDGSISIKELGVSPERFAQLDNDSDGKIEQWEVRRALYKKIW